MLQLEGHMGPLEAQRGKFEADMHPFGSHMGLELARLSVIWTHLSLLLILENLKLANLSFYMAPLNH